MAGAERPSMDCPDIPPVETDEGAKPKMGRPSLYREELIDTILDRLIEGESLRKICSDPDMPAKVTVLKWLDKYDDFAARYARAREMQADGYVDECVTIADQATDPQVARVQIWARQWHAGKMVPKKYGDRQHVEHSGGLTVKHEDALDALEGTSSK